MATSREALERTLAVHDPAALRLILEASDVSPRDAETPADLAKRVADAIWWNYSTPIGYLAERGSFEDVVRHLARRLGVDHRVDPDTDVWEQVRTLTEALVAELPVDGISIETLDPSTRARLSPSWMGALGFGSGATGSFAARWGAGHVVALLKTPIGRLLPLIPYVGPWVGAIKVGASAIHVVSGPLGVAMLVLSVNSSLGTNYARLVPLVLGVGALGPAPIDDAVVIDAGFPSPTPDAVS
jgi:hypothetical protein